MTNSAASRPAGMHPDALAPDFDDWDKEPSVPDHPLGSIRAIDYDTGLPIIKRKGASSQPAQQSGGESTEQPKPEPVKPAAKQPALTKGTAVSLPDGSTGKVAHVIDGKSARVRTEAGKNLVMKQSDLTPAGHVVVKSHLRKLPQ